MKNWSRSAPAVEYVTIMIDSNPSYASPTFSCVHSCNGSLIHGSIQFIFIYCKIVFLSSHSQVVLKPVWTFKSSHEYRIKGEDDASGQQTPKKPKRVAVAPSKSKTEANLIKPWKRSSLVYQALS